MFRPFRFLYSTVFILFFLLIFSVLQVGAKESPYGKEKEYVESLVQKAKKINLHLDRYWYILLHYKKGIFGTKSFIDTPEFFLSPEGKTSPGAELEATIRIFFDQRIPSEKNMTERFVARYTWLKNKLNIDESRLPQPPSKRHLETIKKIDVKSMTLVFPAGYINNPASMYGHTFLIIERKNKSRLLAFSINYQAHATDGKGFFYAFKGLVGLYPGYFDIIPYYDKVEEYSDMDKREIWEYPLKFTHEEITRMLLHLLELNKIHSDYFYLDENCSFNLLFLLEAARPSLRLFEHLSVTVTPIDTLKAVVDSGVVEAPRYRPSKTSKISYFEKMAEPEHLKLVKDIVKKKRKPEDILQIDVPNDTKILISDLLAEYIDYSYTEREIHKKDYIKLYRRSLKVRSKLGKQEKEYPEIEKPSLPESSHDSYMFSSHYMYRYESGLNKSFLLLNLRMSYHSLIDAEEGFNRGSQIVFGDVALRYGITDNKFILQKADIINVMSLVPQSRLLYPLSWKIRTGFMQRLGADNKEHLVYNGSIGGGFAWNVPFVSMLYTIGEVDLDLGPSRDYWVNGTANFALGVLNRLSGWLKIHYSGRVGYFGISDRTLYLNARAEHNFIIARNVSIMATYDFVRMYDHILHDVTVSGNLYF